ncbi:hypothetical protein BOX15_Mlig002880g1 [Macrostomum lignano]|uniref:Uncharacterized protein n=1 Tax=Macrostomum lignano TaxID=282301 RepID=A0A267GMT0_9PLAT|nr:hypothetical protein BOX15_Mlig002880g1 [Macrostomum lignano]
MAQLRTSIYRLFTRLASPLLLMRTCIHLRVKMFRSRTTNNDDDDNNEMLENISVYFNTNVATIRSDESDSGGLLLSRDAFNEWFESVVTELVHRSLARARVLGGDTDSLMMALVMRNAFETPYETLFKDLAAQGLLDTSNYPPTHELYSLAHKGRLLAWKDEFGGRLALEFVFLRPKNYSFLHCNDEGAVRQLSRSKGVCRSVGRSLKHNVFLHVLIERRLHYVTMQTITSRKQLVFSMSQYKQALGYFDTKRAWTSDLVSLPFGHWRLDD